MKKNQFVVNPQGQLILNYSDIVATSEKKLTTARQYIGKPVIGLFSYWKHPETITKRGKLPEDIIKPMVSRIGKRSTL